MNWNKPPVMNWKDKTPDDKYDFGGYYDLAKEWISRKPGEPIKKPEPVVLNKIEGIEYELD
jgi:hypothetical protein